MDEAVRRAIDDVLDLAAREFDALVPPSGPFPERQWEVPLPPPYGPSRRLALRVYPGGAREAGKKVPPPTTQALRCTVEVAVESPDGRADGKWLGATPTVGSRAAMAEELRSPWTRRKIERFLEKYLSGIDMVLAAERPLDIPVTADDEGPFEISLVAVDRDGVLFAALDPREVSVERRGPELPTTAHWHLLLRRGDSWLDAGPIHSQTESDRSFLGSRVQLTLAAFHRLSVEGFGFRPWEGPIREAAGRVPAEEIDRSDPVVAWLREVCRTVIGEIPNAEQAFFVSLAFRDDAEFVLEVQDGFDWSYYYVPVPRGVDPQTLAAEYDARSMQRVCGILRRGEDGLLRGA